MNCTKCGKEIPDGENKLCDECKNSLLTNIGSEEDKKFEMKKEQKAKNISPKKGKKGILIAILIIIVLIVGGVLLEVKTNTISNLFGITNKVGIPLGNSNSNLGFATIQKNWIYYMAMSEDGMKVTINKVKTNGKEKQTLIEKDWEVYSLNVVGDYIYFRAFETAEDGNSENNIIYRMTVNGEELTEINKNGTANDVMPFYVVKDKIYYVGTDYNIYSMDIDGKNTQQIDDHQAGFIGVTDKYILFNALPENPESETDYVTYIMNLDGSDKRVLNGEMIYNPNFVGDTIYYVNAENNEVHKVNVDGTNDEKVYECKAYNMNISGDYIYYLNFKEDAEDYSDDTICIYRVKLDGTGHEVLAEFKYDIAIINIVGDWIYYADYSDNSYQINLMKKNDSSKILNLYKFDFSALMEKANAEETTQKN